MVMWLVDHMSFVWLARYSQARFCQLHFWCFALMQVQNYWLMPQFYLRLIGVCLYVGMQLLRRFVEAAERWTSSLGGDQARNIPGLCYYSCDCSRSSVWVQLLKLLMCLQKSLAASEWTIRLLRWHTCIAHPFQCQRASAIHECHDSHGRGGVGGGVGGRGGIKGRKYKLYVCILIICVPAHLFFRME